MYGGFLLQFTANSPAWCLLKKGNNTPIFVITWLTFVSFTSSELYKGTFPQQRTMQCILSTYLFYIITQCHCKNPSSINVNGTGFYSFIHSFTLIY